MSTIDFQARLLGLQPTTYNSEERSVTAVLSMGSPVKRFYGVECLEISTAAIDLSRVRAGQVPVLDSHQVTSIDHLLGKTVSAWVQGGSLMGKLTFGETPQGARAAGMVERGEAGAISIGYRVQARTLTDDHGGAGKFEVQRLRSHLHGDAMGIG
jgi:hypothetical protein